ncbi:hypothetical protein HXX76_002283 [Chlamydomonas incerta]|uniref:Uncharacterized protein n=1 Tax=Chlamydomonas incerta TaxID=51695 RepID=A0A835WAU2_CHLIN|nr:hypothetical protein HXX76_002283 [Chlamydomonas incerta]|eukprot:KAG2443944.1 hypothetical protein HXX76_002283 [Chlamydomonas incerta]
MTRETIYGKDGSGCLDNIDKVPSSELFKNTAYTSGTFAADTSAGASITFSISVPGNVLSTDGWMYIKVSNWFAIFPVKVPSCTNNPVIESVTFYYKVQILWDFPADSTLAGVRPYTCSPPSTLAYIINNNGIPIPTDAPVANFYTFSITANSDRSFKVVFPTGTVLASGVSTTVSEVLGSLNFATDNNIDANSATPLSPLKVTRSFTVNGKVRVTSVSDANPKSCAGADSPDPAVSVKLVSTEFPAPGTSPAYTQTTTAAANNFVQAVKPYSPIAVSLDSFDSAKYFTSSAFQTAVSLTDLAATANLDLCSPTPLQACLTLGKKIPVTIAGDVRKELNGNTASNHPAEGLYTCGEVTVTLYLGTGATKTLVTSTTTSSGSYTFTNAIKINEGDTPTFTVVVSSLASPWSFYQSTDTATATATSGITATANSLTAGTVYVTRTFSLSGKVRLALPTDTMSSCVALNSKGAPVTALTAVNVGGAPVTYTDGATAAANFEKTGISASSTATLVELTGFDTDLYYSSSSFVSSVSVDDFTTEFDACTPPQPDVCLTLGKKIPVTIAGDVRKELNGNTASNHPAEGLYTCGEVTVTLYLGTGATKTLVTSTTTSSGSYTFTNAIKINEGDTPTFTVVVSSLASPWSFYQSTDTATATATSGITATANSLTAGTVYVTRTFSLSGKVRLALPTDTMSSCVALNSKGAPVTALTAVNVGGAPVTYTDGATAAANFEKTGISASSTATLVELTGFDTDLYYSSSSFVSSVSVDDFTTEFDACTPPQPDVCLTLGKKIPVTIAGDVRKELNGNTASNHPAEGLYTCGEVTVTLYLGTGATKTLVTSTTTSSGSYTFTNAIKINEGDTPTFTVVVSSLASPWSFYQSTDTATATATSGITATANSLTAGTVYVTRTFSLSGKVRLALPTDTMSSCVALNSKGAPVTALTAVNVGGAPVTYTDGATAAANFEKTGISASSTATLVELTGFDTDLYYSSSSFVSSVSVDDFTTEFDACTPPQPDVCLTLGKKIPVTIAGDVRKELNGNTASNHPAEGLYTCGEVTVTLYLGTGATKTLVTSTTTSSGSYTFTNAIKINEGDTPTFTVVVSSLASPWSFYQSTDTATATATSGITATANSLTAGTVYVTRTFSLSGKVRLALPTDTMSSCVALNSKGAPVTALTAVNVGGAPVTYTDGATAAANFEKTGISASSTATLVELTGFDTDLYYSSSSFVSSVSVDDFTTEFDACTPPEPDVCLTLGKKIPVTIAGDVRKELNGNTASNHPAEGLYTCGEVTVTLYLGTGATKTLVTSTTTSSGSYTFTNAIKINEGDTPTFTVVVSSLASPWSFYQSTDTATATATSGITATANSLTAGTVYVTRTFSLSGKVRLALPTDTMSSCVALNSKGAPVTALTAVNVGGAPVTYTDGATAAANFEKTGISASSTATLVELTGFDTDLYYSSSSFVSSVSVDDFTTEFDACTPPEPDVCLTLGKKIPVTIAGDVRKELNGNTASNHPAEGLYTCGEVTVTLYLGTGATKTLVTSTTTSSGSYTFTNAIKINEGDTPTFTVVVSSLASPWSFYQSTDTATATATSGITATANSLTAGTVYVTRTFSLSGKVRLALPTDTMSSCVALNSKGAPVTALTAVNVGGAPVTYTDGATAAANFEKTGISASSTATLVELTGFDTDLYYSSSSFVSSVSVDDFTTEFDACTPPQPDVCLTLGKKIPVTIAGDVRKELNGNTASNHPAEGLYTCGEVTVTLYLGTGATKTLVTSTTTSSGSYTFTNAIKINEGDTPTFTVVVSSLASPWSFYQSTDTATATATSGITATANSLTAGTVYVTRTFSLSGKVRLALPTDTMSSCVALNSKGAPVTALTAVNVGGAPVTYTDGATAAANFEKTGISASSTATLVELTGFDTDLYYSSSSFVSSVSVDDFTTEFDACTPPQPDVCLTLGKKIPVTIAGDVRKELNGNTASNHPAEGLYTCGEVTVTLYLGTGATKTLVTSTTTSSGSYTFTNAIKINEGDTPTFTVVVSSLASPWSFYQSTDTATATATSGITATANSLTAGTVYVTRTFSLSGKVRLALPTDTMSSCVALNSKGAPVTALTAVNVGGAPVTYTDGATAAANFEKTGISASSTATLVELTGFDTDLYYSSSSFVSSVSVDDFTTEFDACTPPQPDVCLTLGKKIPVTIAGDVRKELNGNTASNHPAEGLYTCGEVTVTLYLGTGATKTLVTSTTTSSGSYTFTNAIKINEGDTPTFTVVVSSLASPWSFYQSTDTATATATSGITATANSLTAGTVYVTRTFSLSGKVRLALPTDTMSSCVALNSKGAPVTALTAVNVGGAPVTYTDGATAAANFEKTGISASSTATLVELTGFDTDLYYSSSSFVSSVSVDDFTTEFDACTPPQPDVCLTLGKKIPVTIAGDVRKELNGNTASNHPAEGLYTCGEVTVTLYLGTGATKTLVTSTTTSSGSYTFTNAIKINEGDTPTFTVVVSSLASPWSFYQSTDTATATATSGITATANSLTAGTVYVTRTFSLSGKVRLALPTDTMSSCVALNSKGAPVTALTAVNVGGAPVTYTDGATAAANFEKTGISASSTATLVELTGFDTDLYYSSSSFVSSVSVDDFTTEFDACTPPQPDVCLTLGKKIPVTIAGDVRKELNGNTASNHPAEGLYTCGEVTVTLYLGTGATKTLVTSTTTSSGSYTFTNAIKINEGDTPTFTVVVSSLASPWSFYQSTDTATATATSGITATANSLTAGTVYVTRTFSLSGKVRLALPTDTMSSCVALNSKGAPVTALTAVNVGGAPVTYTDGATAAANFEKTGISASSTATLVELTGFDTDLYYSSSSFVSSVSVDDFTTEFDACTPPQPDVCLTLGKKIPVTIAGDVRKELNGNTASNHPAEGLYTCGEVTVTLYLGTGATKTLVTSTTTSSGSYTFTNAIKINEGDTPTFTVVVSSLASPWSFYQSTDTATATATSGITATANSLTAGTVYVTRTFSLSGKVRLALPTDTMSSCVALNSKGAPVTALTAVNVGGAPVTYTDGATAAANFEKTGISASSTATLVELTGFDTDLYYSSSSFVSSVSVDDFTTEFDACTPPQPDVCLTLGKKIPVTIAGDVRKELNGNTASNHPAEGLYTCGEVTVTLYLGTGATKTLVTSTTTSSGSYTFTNAIKINEGDTPTFTVVVSSLASPWSFYQSTDTATATATSGITATANSLTAGTVYVTRTFSLSGKVRLALPTDTMSSCVALNSKGAPVTALTAVNVGGAPVTYTDGATAAANFEKTGISASSTATLVELTGFDTDLYYSSSSFVSSVSVDDFTTEFDACTPPQPDVCLTLGKKVTITVSGEVWTELDGNTANTVTNLETKFACARGSMQAQLIEGTTVLETVNVDGGAYTFTARRVNEGDQPSYSVKLINPPSPFSSYNGVDTVSVALSGPVTADITPTAPKLYLTRTFEVQPSLRYDVAATKASTPAARCSLPTAKTPRAGDVTVTENTQTLSLKATSTVQYGSLASPAYTDTYSVSVAGVHPLIDTAAAGLFTSSSFALSSVILDTDAVCSATPTDVCLTVALNPIQVNLVANWGFSWLTSTQTYSCGATTASVNRGAVSFTGTGSTALTGIYPGDAVPVTAVSLADAFASFKDTYSFNVETSSTTMSLIQTFTFEVVRTWTITGAIKLDQREVWPVTDNDNVAVCNGLSSTPAPASGDLTLLVAGSSPTLSGAGTFSVSNVGATAATATAGYTVKTEANTRLYGVPFRNTATINFGSNLCAASIPVCLSVGSLVPLSGRIWLESRPDATSWTYSSAEDSIFACSIPYVPEGLNGAPLVGPVGTSSSTTGTFSNPLGLVGRSYRVMMPPTSGLSSTVSTCIANTVALGPQTSGYEKALPGWTATSIIFNFPRATDGLGPGYGLTIGYWRAQVESLGTCSGAPKEIVTRILRKVSTPQQAFSPPGFLPAGTVGTAPTTQKPANLITGTTDPARLSAAITIFGNCGGEQAQLKCQLLGLEMSWFLNVVADEMSKEAAWTSANIPSIVPPTTPFRQLRAGDQVIQWNKIIEGENKLGATGTSALTTQITQWNEKGYPSGGSPKICQGKATGRHRRMAL